MAWFIVNNSARLGVIKNVNSFMSDTSIFSSLRYKTRSHPFVLLNHFSYILSDLLIRSPRTESEGSVLPTCHCRKYRQGADTLDSRGLGSRGLHLRSPKSSLTFKSFQRGWFRGVFKGRLSICPPSRSVLLGKVLEFFLASWDMRLVY